MIDDPKIVSKRLKNLRLALGFTTQVAFADHLGIEKNTYNPFEKGSRELTFETACLIRKKFKIPIGKGAARNEGGPGRRAGRAAKEACDLTIRSRIANFPVDLFDWPSVVTWMPGPPVAKDSPQPVTGVSSHA